jgi:flavin-dependent dehydrogenase
MYADESVVDCAAADEGVEVRTTRGCYRARFVIGADGANSRVAQRLFPDRKARCIAALESEVPMNGASSYPGAGHILVDVGATSRGYAWVFPKQERLSVGLGDFRGRQAGLKLRFARFISNDSHLSMLDVPPASGHPIPLYDAGMTGVKPPSLVNRCALLVGDAGHLVDPLFGEGIYYAVRSGQLAANAIVGCLTDKSRSVHDYDAAVQREIYPEFNVAARLAQVIYTFPRLCHRLLFHYGEIIGLYYDVLRGRQTYQSFYGEAKGLIKGSIRDLLRKAL